MGPQRTVVERWREFQPHQLAEQVHQLPLRSLWILGGNVRHATEFETQEVQVVEGSLDAHFLGGE